MRKCGRIISIAGLILLVAGLSGLGPIAYVLIFSIYVGPALMIIGAVLIILGMVEDPK